MRIYCRTKSDNGGRGIVSVFKALGAGRWAWPQTEDISNYIDSIMFTCAPMIQGSLRSLNSNGRVRSLVLVMMIKRNMRGCTVFLRSTRA